MYWYVYGLIYVSKYEVLPINPKWFRTSPSGTQTAPGEARRTLAPPHYDGAGDLGMAPADENFKWVCLKMLG